MQVVLFWEVTASGAPGWLRYVFGPYLFLLSDTFSTPWFLVCNRFLYKLFSKTVFVGLRESTSLLVEILVGVRLPTAGSPQTPRKRDSHCELLLLLFNYY